jgi:hypothetical protein
VSTERQGGFVVFTCDTCTEIRESDERDFNAALAEAKGAGWQAYQLGGLWCHRCANCAEDR